VWLQYFRCWRRCVLEGGPASGFLLPLRPSSMDHPVRPPFHCELQELLDRGCCALGPSWWTPLWPLDQQPRYCIPPLKLGSIEILRSGLVLRGLVIAALWLGLVTGTVPRLRRPMSAQAVSRPAPVSCTRVGIEVRFCLVVRPGGGVGPGCCCARRLGSA
jgi:hypothetical protein